MVLGAGMAPAGSSIVGYGSPSMVNSSTAKLWIKSDGSQGNCAKIDPTTGDYALDGYGNSIGDDSINQMVYLAFRTILNSSTIKGFGIDINVTDYTMSTNIEKRVKLAVLKAVKHLTDPKIITIESIIVNRLTPTGIDVKINWINNSTGQLNEFTL